jgi:hypothetical protein
MARLLFSCLIAAFIAAPVAAHHEVAGKSHAVATVTLGQSLMADGKRIAPGKYEVWILDERPMLNGVPTENQRVVELVQNGTVIAREVAEMSGANAPAPVGTSGKAPARAMGKATVQTLKGGEYVRIAITDGGARYLIHLPTEQFAQPEPRPDPPARIELPPKQQ